MKFTELKQRVPQHVIIGADPKAGKSTLASKLAEHGFKLLWFSLDGGHSVLTKLSQKAQENIEIIVLPDTKSFPVAVKTIKDILVKPNDTHEVCDAHGQISCMTCRKDNRSFSYINLSKIAFDPDYTWVVVIDQISQLADSADNYVRKAAGLKDDEKFEYSHFAHWQNIMKEIMSAIQNAPYNVLCLAHLVESEMEDGKKKLVPMVGSTVYSRKVGGYFDHCIFLEIANMAHKGASGSTFRQSILTGSRMDIKIEDQKELSLVPFFDGTIKKPQERIAVEDVKALKQEVATPTPVPSQGPEAGASTSMHKNVAPNDRALDLLKGLKR